MNKNYIKLFTCCMLAISAMAFSTVISRAETSPEDQKTIDELKKTYPLDTCPVSGEKLDGEMGKPIDYLYKYKGADGKEVVRLIRFCCGGCPKTFLKDPQKYLKIIDDAAKSKKVSSNEKVPGGGCTMAGCPMN